MCNTKYVTVFFAVSYYVLYVTHIGWQLAVSKILKISYHTFMENYRKSFALTFTVFFVIMLAIISFLFFSPVINAF